MAAPDLGWASEVVTNPAAFQALMEASPRDGWTALHAHDYPAALTHFRGGGDPALSEAGAVRALLAEVALDEDLQRLTGVASSELFVAWSARGPLPQGAAVIATLAARCSGQDAAAWATHLPEPARFLATDADPWSRFVGGGTASTVVEGLPDSVVERMRLHAAAHTAPLGPALSRAAVEPLLEAEADGLTRTWYDPCVHRTLADEARRALGPDPGAAVAALGDQGLAGALFAPWLDGEDLSAQLAAGVPVSVAGSQSAALEAALGLPATPPTTDDAETARVEIRVMDTHLDAARGALDALADADGAALLGQVGVVDRLRQEVLVVRARRDLRAGRPHRALATLLLARDVTDRTIGPRNSPALMALLAEANLQTGRSREALDALQLLAGRRPEVLGLRELVGDLSVLQGLDRRGDSKEH